MSRNRVYVSRSPLAQASHTNTYDPSAPYRAMMMPPPPPPPPPSPPAPPTMPPINQYSSNRIPLHEIPPTNNNQMHDSNPNIPQYYRSHRDQPNDFPSYNVDYVPSQEIHSSYRQLPHVNEQAVPNDVNSYPQPIPVSYDPNATGSFYTHPYPYAYSTPYAQEQPSSNIYYAPYSTPYVMPMTGNVPPVNAVPYTLEQPTSNIYGVPYSTPYVVPVTSNVPPTHPVTYSIEQPISDMHGVHYSTPHTIPVHKNVTRINQMQPIHNQSISHTSNSQQKDTDLSRLEVYHFTPKQNTPVAVPVYPAQPGQPMPQYYTYPYSAPPVAPPPAILPPPQQQYSTYPHPYYGYQSYSYPSYPSPDYSPYGYPYYPEPPRTFLPPIPTKARHSQTDLPKTTTRGVSPMHLHSAAFDKTNYHPIHQRILLTDRYPATTDKTDKIFHHSIYSSPLPDCRCIHCQRERAKVLNYYSE